MEQAAIALLDNGAIPSSVYGLSSAVYENKPELLKAFLRNGFEIETRYIHHIGYMKNPRADIVELSDHDPIPVNGNLLDLANARGYREITEILKASPANLEPLVSPEIVLDLNLE